MDNIKLNSNYASGFVRKHEIEFITSQILDAHEKLHNKTGPGNEYTGWVSHPKDYDKEEFERILAASEKIKANSEVLIVIGIGGSYLGAKAAIDMLNHTHYNSLPKAIRKTPEIYYIGNNLSPVYLKDLMDIIANKDLSINVISKSGTTTEPAIAFRIFKEFMENKYGKEGAKERIFATTDKEKGALKKLAEAEGYETFVISDDIGGRYSVLTAVGLLPIAVSGADIKEIMHGALDGMVEYSNKNIEENAAYQYVAYRNALYRKNKNIEILVNYEPSMHYFAEWWKQLFGESEGKDFKGIFPAAVEFTTDLHSMGQYIQDGMRCLFETVINIKTPKYDFLVKEDKDNIDGLNFLSNNTLDYINKKAMEGTILAHNDGGVPNIIIEVPQMNEYYYGKLVYFFEKACGISGYLLGVNPFDQPGVEAYKKNMFKLLGKPGY